MEIGIGAVMEGKVTGITKFGAFLSLPTGATGMVHISEVAHTYVSDIKDYLTEGQTVKVKVIGIDKEGRINLSIKKAQEPPAQPQRAPAGQSSYNNRKPILPKEAPTFEDKLKVFMQDSESKMSDLKHYIDKKSGSSRKSRPKQ